MKAILTILLLAAISAGIFALGSLLALRRHLKL